MVSVVPCPLEYPTAAVRLQASRKVEERQRGGWHLEVEVSSVCASHVSKLTRFSARIRKLIRPNAGLAAEWDVWCTHASLWERRRRGSHSQSLRRLKNGIRRRRRVWRGCKYPLSKLASGALLLRNTTDIIFQRTPAWDPGNRTSYGGSTANDPFSAARTPAYEPSSRTPAYTASYNHDPYAAFGQSNHSAPNDPRNARTAYDAPTPAAAPTPTNGIAYSAPTPAAAAATPYGGEVETPYTGQPETPGFGDDGPRYEEGTPSP